MSKSVHIALKEMVDALHTANIPHPDRQAQLLLCDLLSCTPSELYLQSKRELTFDEWDRLHYRLKERIRGVPLQYLRGEVEFYHCSIEVSPSVLIPRQETEILVDKIIQRLSRLDCRGKVLWDVCCGSGCIGIALKKHLPDLKITLSDISDEALKLAASNAKRNGVHVDFLSGDLLNPFGEKKTDFFVCNPPYISIDDYENLEKEVLEHEPLSALLAGEEGIEFYRRLSKELPRYLNPGALVWFEIGHDQGAAVLGLFDGELWKNQRIEKDWSNQDRFFYAELISDSLFP